jgi:hypothetical protein
MLATVINRKLHIIQRIASRKCALSVTIQNSTASRTASQSGTCEDRVVPMSAEWCSREQRCGADRS